SAPSCVPRPATAFHRHGPIFSAFASTHDRDKRTLTTPDRGFAGSDHDYNGRLGKRGTSSSVGRFRPWGGATTIARPRSIVLDCDKENLERLENGAGDRSARNRDLMAAQAIQTVLVEPVAAERTRPPASKFGDP